MFLTPAVALTLLWACPGLRAQTALVGMTSKGGNYGLGAIISVIPGDTGLLQQHALFSASPGAFPGYSKLITASNGKMYGMTTNGGMHNKGVIFEYDFNNNTYTRKVDFNGINGSYPYGSLVQASNGKLYGFTHQTGGPSWGTLFEYDYNSNSCTMKVNFTGSNGRYPIGSLMEAANGKLYGMASGGGDFEKGVLFEYDFITNTYVKIYDFDGINGHGPYGSLMEAANGKLYGMTHFGGTADLGLIFEYDYVNVVYNVKHYFYQNNGKYPYGDLVEASNGKLYGTTSEGGWYNAGVIFEFDYVTGICTTKAEFNNSIGRNPHGSLMECNGKLYGLASDGGASGKGTLVEFDFVTNALTKKVDLTGSNGNKPLGTPTLASNGKIYGLTNAGGTAGQGVIFEYNPLTDTYVRKVSLNASSGAYPFGSLMQTTNGKIFGLTSEGGTAEKGVIFEYDFHTNTYTKKADLNSCQGKTPYGSLIQASNGKFYGTTFFGGTYDDGTLFEYDSATGTCQKLVDFFNTNSGRFPYGALVEASNGKLYGSTGDGGSHGRGVIFEYDYNLNVFTKKADFDVGDGVYPVGSLVEANSKLYGMTKSSDMSYKGVIFEYDYNANTLIKKKEFIGSDGSYPRGSLTLGANGKLFGMTSWGGAYDKGVLFEYDPVTNSYDQKLNFDTTTGYHPHGTLLQASNGKLYGMNQMGGDYNQGVLFEYDYISNTYTKKRSLSDSTGSYPMYGHLIEINIPTGIPSNTAPLLMSVFPNPTRGSVAVESHSMETGNREFRVFDLTGRELKRVGVAVAAGMNRTELDLRDCCAGIYLLQMTDGEGGWSVCRIAVE